MDDLVQVQGFTIQDYRAWLVIVTISKAVKRWNVFVHGRFFVPGRLIAPRCLQNPENRTRGFYHRYLGVIIRAIASTLVLAMHFLKTVEWGENYMNMRF